MQDEELRNTGKNEVRGRANQNNGLHRATNPEFSDVTKARDQIIDGWCTFRSFGT